MNSPLHNKGIAKLQPSFSNKFHALKNTILKRDPRFPLEQQYKLEQGLRLTRERINVTRPQYYEIASKQIDASKAEKAKRSKLKILK